MSDEDREHPASAARREDALKRGQGPCTPEIAGALIAVSVAALGQQLPVSLSSAFTRTIQPLWSAQSFSDLSSGTLDLGALTPAAAPPGLAVLALVPVAIGLSLWMQKGLRFAPERTAPDLKRLMLHAPWGEPLEIVESLVRGLARLGLGFYVGYRLCGTFAFPLFHGMAIGGKLAGLFGEVAGLWAALAAADWLWRRFRFERSIMMTSAEVRQENRSTEGSPQVREEIRSRMEETMKAGPSRRLLLREGDVVALVTIFSDPTRVPVVRIGARGPQGEQLVAGSERLGVPVLAMPGVRALAGARPGSAIPEELFGELAGLHARYFPRAPRGEQR